MTVTELPRHRADEPRTAAERWTPSRAGILNVWRYYDEVFTFHEGRLLLRGPNGTGKSKALELLLPFLFDANLRANRLSTFGTGERTMHWNLMGEGASGTTRVGYVWLEFRHAGDPEQSFGCGARLQASTHTTTVHADYFTTRLRIAEPGGLALANGMGQPLTKGALEEALGEHGTVYDNAGDYRAAVRSTLFPGMNEQRYDALITALLQLRTPKLSQRLDPALLSTLLSRALPPLGQQEIADLAEGFERLDAQRDRLAALEKEVDATRTLAARQRTYAQRVMRSTAAKLISATTELDGLARAARESAQKYEQVESEQAKAEARVAKLGQELADAQARRSGLIDSEAYKKGQELLRLRGQTADAAKSAARIRADAAGKRATADGDALAARQAAQRVADLSRVVSAAEAEVQRAATRAGLVSVHEEVAACLSTDRRRARSLLRAAVRSRRHQLDEVKLALEKHERAVDLRGQAEAALEAARGALAGAGEALKAAAIRRERALEQLGSDLTRWAADCRELVFPDPAALLDHLESEPGLLAVVEAAAAAVAREITLAEAAFTADLNASLATRANLAADLDAITAQRDLPPPAPATRTTDRGAMPGAPLWRLVDFAPDVPAEACAGIEAALEASGLLDAWLGPHGEIPGHDVFADPAALPPVAGRSLADVLVPEQDADVPMDAVRRLLAAVAVGDRLPAEGAAAMGTDGTWRMASLTGSWSKEQPAHIGAIARQRARERRAQELREQIDDLDVRIELRQADLAALQARREALVIERSVRPGYTAVDEATRDLSRAESDHAAAETSVRGALSAVKERERQVSAALRDLTGLAAEHGVPTHRSAIDALSTAIGAFGDQADNWLDANEDLSSARGTAGTLDTQAARSADIAQAREDEAVEAEEGHQALAARLEAIDAAFGMGYNDVLAEIEALGARSDELGREQRALSIRLTGLARQLGSLDTQRTVDAAARDTAAQQRDIAVHRFRRLAGGTLSADSGLDDLAAFKATLSASDGVRAALDAARLVAAAWPNVPHAPNNLGDALHRLSESVHDCRDTLRSRADLDLETDEDVQVFTAVVDGLRVGTAELLDILRGGAEQSRREITDRERELFDQTLTGDTRRHLAARIRQANELVDGMNNRLELVRTASKVAVRLVWQIAPDLPAGTKAARDLLLRDPVRLTEADRESLHRFFRERIEQARADDTATGWERQLAEVFDYTAWHQFAVKVDRANGDGWQLLTKKLHGALSGGEKAIALHLPLFAAVAAHYQAVPQAPRMILLDEVFVGVDTVNRGRIFALLSALDLDLVLTSDHEWCTYAELSGIGIHQLITGDDGDDAVTTARFTWNGHSLVSDTSASV